MGSEQKINEKELDGKTDKREKSKKSEIKYKLWSDWWGENDEDELLNWDMQQDVNANETDQDKADEMIGDMSHSSSSFLAVNLLAIFFLQGLWMLWMDINKVYLMIYLGLMENC